ncbi:hypothetical protein KMI_07g12600 [Encephalitozoon hellem]|uniref:Uncharacterized protein n=1 Tax=Encephalitozoon hellem TaxID=27973 RepID=A0A9Q9F802_ENCHE|nr:uncharacterized protein EHEL_031475 [Encephalitozoon hellem ATCC 50504]AHL28916.1 hypothetical protein EHEL_031475 [Encephalitozoon hellem ATCC 50504]KAG5859416.1 hypothetical protein KMI_07g12600 [Encephalitozoon hellem]UTX42848.1 hypothetical protein GPU96_03g05720 [Encephalitozoon hellem]WEL38307.1 hypothetical protein PFJ87_03g01670 [Encephalitozoon hellem]
MAEKKITKHDFDIEYPLWNDMDKDKIQFRRLDNGYSIVYEDEEKHEDENRREYRSRSISFSQTYGERKLKDANMVVEDNKIKVKGWFDNKE